MSYTTESCDSLHRAEVEYLISMIVNMNSGPET